MSTSIRKVQKIERRASLFAAQPETKQRKKRVAAYARVSTDSDEQLSSYEAQVDFYTRHIKSNPEWELIDVYTDEGISGTNTKKREGFNRMIADALSGKIDLILTKSISRFARNTVDTLTTVRHLKEKGIEVYFEKENIYTLDAKGEVMITIMSSLAQEESRSISENVTWGKRKSMEDGKFSLVYKYFLGYEKGENGLPQIVESEAEIVRKIYSLFLEGQTIRSIADYLTAQGIPTPKRKSKWCVSTIMSILQNEKYKGDALLQKTYTADFLTKSIKKNHGEVPQYYIQNSHPAIIAPETFDLVQQEIERRNPNRRQLHRSSPFSAKIACEECGGFYGRKIWHSSDKHKKYIWRCNQKYVGDLRCSTPNLLEKDIEEGFVIAFNQLLRDKEWYIQHFTEILSPLTDASEFEQQLTEKMAAHADLLEQMRSYMAENTRQIQDQVEYNRHFNKMDAECRQIEEQVASLKAQILDEQARKEKIRRCLEELRQRGEALTEFDIELWSSMIDKVSVAKDKTLSFRLQDGSDILVNVSGKR